MLKSGDIIGAFKHCSMNPGGGGMGGGSRLGLFEAPVFFESLDFPESSDFSALVF
jgi:hypothetical protein